MKRGHELDESLQPSSLQRGELANWVKAFLENMAGLSAAEGRRQGGEGEVGGREGGGAGRCGETAWWEIGGRGREWRVFSVGRKGGSDRRRGEKRNATRGLKFRVLRKKKV